ncbi:thiol-disulfide oxidoreductase DCC family protein [uncultured Lacinutrix sp.]|uniref:thiol-disulfide oxidoreductase DCC family protein n=1 Tax=uncultured Lacinutrix sp. TaxID=574032 RepID=UPI00260526D0|nr:DCC1-like thiol-disulfide oxidoreductase family protein [uncultured Lacinutrix sp.]
MNNYQLDQLITNYNIVIYDGVCGFCDASIQFILNRKPSEKIRFISFQSIIGQQIMFKFKLEISLDSIVFVEKGNVHQKAKAFFKILKHVNSYWYYLHYLQIIPNRLSNFCYDIIAKHRYLIMGKVEQCRLLTPEEKKFFIITQ